MTSAVRYANKLTHLFFMSCHECMMHKYKKQRLGVYLQHAQCVLARNHLGRCFFAVKCR